MKWGSFRRHGNLESLLMKSVALDHDPTWITHPSAHSIIRSSLDRLCDRSEFVANLGQRMLAETGTQLFDWLDRISTSATASELTAAGFVRDSGQQQVTYRHPQAQLPVVVVDYGKELVAIKVESVPKFLLAHGFDSRSQIFGNPGAALRRSCVDCHTDFECWVVERHGYQGWQSDDVESDFQSLLAHHAERLMMRRRHFDNVIDGFHHARRLIEEAMHQIGRERACDLFFETERAYWQSRNDAGAIQRMRQDRLGLGWANHDHHTYRSSRQAFVHLISFLELLGFECRERFYAGRQAGWGAQVIEHRVCGITIFADVDLAPEEILQDFAHEPLSPRDSLGTVGMWCALHGEAFLAAGMHHLECQFDFDHARDQLATQGVGTMKPFTDLPYLRQAFTEGQTWPVSEQAIETALAHNWITPSQAQAFRAHGAIGSHLEILQRRDGYKGFNQTGISDIISATDPRKQLADVE